jgi:hypothetical protein
MGFTITLLGLLPTFMPASVEPPVVVLAECSFDYFQFECSQMNNGLLTSFS